MMNMTTNFRAFFLAAAAAVFALSATPVQADINYAQLQWNARTSTFPAYGSADRLRGSIAVTADADTNWSLSGVPAWMTVLSGSPWNGSGVVTFQLAENPGPARTVTLSVGGFSFEIFQAGGDCETSISPAGGRISSGGASERTFNVQGDGSCFWRTGARNSWISVVTPGGSGTNAVVYAVGGTTERRSGSIVVGSSVYTVDQDGTQPCNYLPSPLYYDFPAIGGIGSFDLFLNGNCGGWTVTSDSPWVTVNTTSGSGSGTATYTVAANPYGYPRQAVLIVNNQPHFVYQAPSPTPGQVVLQPNGLNGQDTSWGSGYYQNGTPHDQLLTYGGSGDSFSDYFQFDLTSGFPATNVVKAELQLFVTTVAPSDPRLQLWHLTQSWTESSVTSTNNPAGVVIRNLPAFRAGWNSIDVTDLYKRWKRGSYSNFGVKIAPASTPTNARGYLASSDHGEAVLRPRLVVTYSEETIGASIANQQNLRVVGGNGYQELYYNFDTRETSVSPYTYASGSVPWVIPTGQWAGMYHYDYAAGRFTQAVYSGRSAINRN